MAPKISKSAKAGAGKMTQDQMDHIVARARKAKEERLKGYREQSLKIHPWVCARCGREFTGANLHLLTVHHKDHNHENNPSDGSNWENLCIYCHDNEHTRYLDHEAGGGAGHEGEKKPSMSHKPFAVLADLLGNK